MTENFFEGTADNPVQVRNVLDRNAGTVWNTSDYVEQFPNGTKEGMGLLFTLPEDRQLVQTWITAGSPIGVEIRYTDDPSPSSLDDTTVVATADLREGLNEIPIDDTAQTRYVLVWISELAQNRNGQFNATIADVGFQAQP